MNSLRVDNITGGYGALTAIRGVSLTVTSGNILVVLGRNGAGKTSLLSAISGLLPNVTSGSIAIDGEPIEALPGYKRVKRGLSFVQEGKRIFKTRTVEENILLGTYPLPGWSLRTSMRKQALENAYARFPVLAEKSKDKAGGLSGGQQQMLAIAQALASNPSILLMDEPSAGLAPSIVNDVFATAKLLREEGLALIIVEQLVEVALSVADHVAVLDSGQIVSDGPAELYEDGTLLQTTYLGAD